MSDALADDGVIAISDALADDGVIALTEASLEGVIAMLDALVGVTATDASLLMTLLATVLAVILAVMCTHSNNRVLPFVPLLDSESTTMLFLPQAVT